MEIYLPNYHGGSIVNLMSSIAQASGGRTPYVPLKNLYPDEIINSKNIVLIIIDALGYDYLKKHDSFLAKNIRCAMTSVTWPTTACAITTFLTGVPPQQHAITGWYVNLKELGMVTTILPFVPRVKGSISEERVNIGDIMDEKGFFQKIKRKSYVVCDGEINHSRFNAHLCKGAKLVDTKNMHNFFRRLEQTINKSGRKYIHAYWGDFDELCHEYGKEDKKVEAHFNKLDKKFRQLVSKIRGTDTILLITADHGSTYLPINKRILLENHPKLKECLSAPLCGDARSKSCYVHPSKAKQFEDYIKNNLSNYCWLFKTEELIKRNFFGLGKPNPKLFDRLGDYILIMKGNYIFKDSVIGEKDNLHLGNHGGMSKEEMLVPLIIFKC